MAIPVSDKAVLQLVQSGQATSQIQVARQLGVSTNTVHGIVRRLLDQQLLEPSAVSRQQRGRPALHYRVRLPEAVLAIQWLGTVWHGGVIQSDPKNDTVSHWNTPLIPDSQAAVAAVAENARRLMEAAALKPKELRGCALSINAARNKGTGRLTSSVIPWAGELDEAGLSRAVGVPVRIVVAPGAAEAELSARAQSGCRRLVVLNVGDGVSAHGCGHTHLWAEVEMWQGEIGHIVTEPRGRMCGCGHRGCLETVLAGSAVQQRVREDVQAGLTTRLAEALRATPPHFFDTLEVMHAERSDSYAVTIVEEFLDRCAWAVSIVMNMVNPDVIVLAGYALDGRTGWMDHIRRNAVRKILQGEQSGLRLEFPRSTPQQHLRRLAESAFLNNNLP